MKEIKQLEIIISFLRNELNLKNKIINETTSLSELGLDGDDVLDLLLKFFRSYNIEFENTNYLDFVPKESGFLYSTMSYLFRFKIKKIEKEIYVQDLLNSLLLKRWNK